MVRKNLSLEINREGGKKEGRREREKEKRRGKEIEG